MKTFMLFSLLVLSATALADETIKTKTQEVTSDAGRAVKKSTREIKDSTCPLVNGKMDCAAKKVKHTIQNTTDKVEDAVD